MASQHDNPYKRMKKSLKGMKPSGEMVHKMAIKSVRQKAVKTTGKFGGKSNKLGQGGRAAQLKAQGVPGGVIGNLARAAQAAPGQKNFHKKKVSVNTEMAMKKKSSTSMKGNKEMKASKKGVIGMKGDIKRKGSMENATASAGPKATGKNPAWVGAGAAKPMATPKVNISPSQGWITASGKSLKKSKKK